MVDVSARTVLIVDDEELIRLVLVDLFTDAGFQTIEASNADAALSVLAGRPEGLDLLVTDVRMPGNTDGLSLASWTRESLPGTMIIIMSGFVSPRGVGAAHAFDAFLSKPVTPARLISVAEELLAS